MNTSEIVELKGCLDCGKPLSHFNARRCKECGEVHHREYNRRYYHENKERWDTVRPKELRRRNMDILASVRDFCACEECGRTDRLHFHHRDPATKKFDMANAAARSVVTVMDELAKCAVLCIHCHMRLHMKARYAK